jgi:hypothetical protein
LGILNSTLINWYYQKVNYLEIGKPMAEVKGIYIKKIPVAIGMDEQRAIVEQYVKDLLHLCQLRYNEKNDFIHYIIETYEPKKLSEKLMDFELLSFKDFLEELRKAKVKLTASMQKDLIIVYDEFVDSVSRFTKQIEMKKEELDNVVFNIYNIPNEDKEFILK